MLRLQIPSNPASAARSSRADAAGQGVQSQMPAMSSSPANDTATVPLARSRKKFSAPAANRAGSASGSIVHRPLRRPVVHAELQRPALTGSYLGTKNDVWVSGADGALLHWDGTTLSGIHKQGTDELFATGFELSADHTEYLTMGYHFNGTSWTSTQLEHAPIEAHRYFTQTTALAAGGRLRRPEPPRPLERLAVHRRGHRLRHRAPILFQPPGGLMLAAGRWGILQHP